MNFVHSIRLALLAGFLFTAEGYSDAPYHYSGDGVWAPGTYLGNIHDPTPLVYPMEAIASESPAKITLKFYSTTTPSSGINTNVSGTYDIFRKDPLASSWGSPIGTVTVGTDISTWDDTNVTVGQVYEYCLAATGTTSLKFANILAGIKADRTEPRGRMALVVADDIPTQLPAEYAQYKADLVADGWLVHEIQVARAKDYTSNGTGAKDVMGIPTAPFPTAHIDIRNQLIALYQDTGNQYPGLPLKNVVLLGKVPVARSGLSYSGPDGHGNVSAQGADAFYADMDGVWPDVKSNFQYMLGGLVAGFVNNADGSVTCPTGVTIDATFLSNLRVTYASSYAYVLEPAGNYIVYVSYGRVYSAFKTFLGYTNNPDGTVTLPRGVVIDQTILTNARLAGSGTFTVTGYIFIVTGGNVTAMACNASLDISINAADGTLNVPGDNKYDAESMSQITNPNSNVEIGFGRIDLSNNVPGEYEAMRMYFNKLHRYKTASPDFLPGRKAIMRSSFGMVTKEYLGLTGVLGMTNLDYIKSTDLPGVPANFDDDSAYTAEDPNTTPPRPARPYLFYFKGSGGTGYSDGGRAVFWTGMQSHWGYWYANSISSGCNLMQRRLAEDNYCLSFTWSIGGLGYQHDTYYFYYRLGMGFDAGDMMRVSSSASSRYASAPCPMFMDHMGDPALRLFPFPPPTNLSVVRSGNNSSLIWTAAVAPAAGEPQVVGYHVYRSSSADGPFTRITSTPVVGTAYLDNTVSSGTWHYQVKAVRLETTGGGTYYNTSLGAQQSIDLTNTPAPVAITTTSLPEANWNTNYLAALTATGGTPIYNWTVISGSLPPGLTLSTAGNIAGIATAGGTYSFTVQALDQAGQTVQKALLLTVQSNYTKTFYAEANSYCTSTNSNTFPFYNASLLMAGPSYLYQPFLRFDVSSLPANNSFVRAKLILTLDERSQASSYAMARAVLTEDYGDGWNEFNTATKSITGVTNNGSNQTRVTCPGHGMTTQTTATTTIAGVTGTNKANANKILAVTIIDENTFDLPTLAYDPTLVWSGATSAPINGLKWANRPLDDASVPQTYASSFPVAYGTIEIDVTPQVRATLTNDPVKKLGLRLYTTRTSGFGSEVRIATRYASGNARPRLVIETTNAPAITITSPTVNPAGIHVGSALAISATATPIPAQAGSLSVQWSKLSGPGMVTFGTPAQAATTATFSAVGDYVLRLTAYDGLLVSTKDLTVRVWSVPAGTTPVSGPALDSSLILRLPFDETTGPAATDASGVSPANNGTLATIGATGNPTWAGAGKVGGAINFDGTGQRVEINDSATTPLDGMQKLTVSLWVKLNLNASDTNNHGILVKQTNTTTSTASYAITLTSAEKISVSVANKTAVVGDTVLAENQWYHVVMVYDGSLATNNLQLYLNGNPDKFGNIATGLTENAIPRISASKLRVGDYTTALLNATNRGFNGKVDEVRLYNQALTLDEIQELASAAPSNMGPKIALGTPTVSGPVGTQLALGATVTDDGLPGAVSVGWSKSSGPGSVVFSNPVSSTTNATTSTAGSYGLRITANDGSITTFADVAASFEASGGIDNWRLFHFGTSENSGDAADGANPKHDGLSNLLKYVLGLDPNIDYSNSPLAPKGQMEKVSGQDYLTFTFTRDTAVTDATLSVEVVNDLASPTWTTIDPLNPANQVEVLENTPSAGIQTITVKDTQPVTSAAKRFMRLKVTRP